MEPVRRSGSGSPTIEGHRMLMPFRFRARSGATVAALLFAVPWSGAGAQSRGAGDSVVVTPGAEYKAGGPHRFFFGSRYRRLWTSSLRLPVLDLQHFASSEEHTAELK